jgi:hypothetical protein
MQLPRSISAGNIYASPSDEYSTWLNRSGPGAKNLPIAGADASHIPRSRTTHKSAPSDFTPAGKGPTVIIPVSSTVAGNPHAREQPCGCLV